MHTQRRRRTGIRVPDGLLWAKATAGMYPEGEGFIFSPMDMIRLDLEIYMNDPQRMEKLKTFNIY